MASKPDYTEWQSDVLLQLREEPSGEIYCYNKQQVDETLEILKEKRKHRQVYDEGFCFRIEYQAIKRKSSKVSKGTAPRHIYKIDQRHPIIKAMDKALKAGVKCSLVMEVSDKNAPELDTVIIPYENFQSKILTMKHRHKSPIKRFYMLYANGDKTEMEEV